MAGNYKSKKRQLEIEEIKENLKKNLDVFVKECKQFSVWGFVIIGALFATDEKYDKYLYAWLFIIAFIFGMALLLNLITYYEKAAYWYRMFKEYLSENEYYSKTEASTQIIKAWKDAGIIFVVNIIGYMCLAFGFMVRALDPCWSDFASFVTVLWFIFIIGLLYVIFICTSLYERIRNYISNIRKTSAQADL